MGKSIWSDLEDGIYVDDEEGTKIFIQNGELHNAYGPAIEYPDGSKAWLQEGKIHRRNGPAVERADGINGWYVHDRLHRIDGPAIEHPDGNGHQWYFDGKKYTFDKWLVMLSTTIDREHATMMKLQWG